MESTGYIEKNGGQSNSAAKNSETTVDYAINILVKRKFSPNLYFSGVFDGHKNTIIHFFLNLTLLYNINGRVYHQTDL